MTENDSPSVGPSTDAPEPVISKGRGISLIWLIPLVAIAVGASIGVQAIRNRGVHVVINAPNAEWVEEGKTKIRYLNVDIGLVDEVRFGKKLDDVELHCTLNAGAREHLTEGTQFWVVHPRVGSGGISGLGTILSGAYIAMGPGSPDGPKRHEFDALAKPPLESEHAPGLTIRLHAEKLNSLDAGSPIYFRELKVGKVERHQLAKDGSSVVLSLFFPEEHADLVREDSRFWNVGGVHISGSLARFEVDAHPLDALLMGGIAFDSPRGQDAKPPEKDADFWLHPSRSDVESYSLRYGGLRVFVEGPQLGSVAIGDRVLYRELPVGAVVSQELMKDSRHVRIGLNIQRRYATLVRSNSVFWNASGISAKLGLGGLKLHAESLAAILAGGIAFATPNAPGHDVKPGSVFELHPEYDDKWSGWSPLIWRGPPGEAPKEAAPKATVGTKISRFFHHKGKSEDEAKASAEPSKDAKQENAHEKKRHGFFGRLFHKKDEAPEEAK